MQAKTELLQLKGKLQRQIATFEAEMATVDRAIQLLEREDAAEVGEHQQHDRRFAKVGLSDTLRIIVGSEWITPVEVRNQMLKGGYRAANRQKLLSAVYATIKRLAKKEFESKRIDGKMKYRKRQLAALSATETAA